MRKFHKRFPGPNKSCCKFRNTVFGSSCDMPCRQPYAVNQSIKQFSTHWTSACRLFLHLLDCLNGAKYFWLGGATVAVKLACRIATFPAWVATWMGVFNARFWRFGSAFSARSAETKTLSAFMTATWSGVFPSWSLAPMSIKFKGRKHP